MTYEFPTTCNLVYLIQGNRVLLIMKKRGFGEGKYNGPGGKVKDGESIIESAIREVEEEVGMRAKNLEEMGVMEFVFTAKPEWNQKVYVYRTSDFEGEPQESEESRPEWFEFENIPYDKTWDDDKYWFPLLLRGEKFRKRFYFGDNNGTVIRQETL